MCEGGGWDPGEATDDTQMAVLVGESLLERRGLDLPDIFGRFQRWAASDPKDIGLQTEDVLTNGEPWDLAAPLHFQVTGRAAGNGSLMRASTSAVAFASAGLGTTMEVARRIAALTHGDRAAWEGTAILHELVRVALDGADPLAAVESTPAQVDAGHRARWANGSRTGLAPRRRDGVQRRGVAVPGLRAVGAAYDGFVRGFPRGGDRHGRRHGHGGGGDGDAGRGRVRGRGDLAKVAGAPACAAAGGRRPGAVPV